MTVDYNRIVSGLEPDRIINQMIFGLDKRQRYLLMIGTCRIHEIYSNFHDLEEVENTLKYFKSIHDSSSDKIQLVDVKITNHFQSCILSTLVQGNYRQFLWYAGIFINNSLTAKKIIKLIGNIVDPGWNFNARWRTTDSVPLAAQMYETEDFSLMPILADALQDAGCDEEELLGRMRNLEIPWCCGCRIIDKILQKR